MPKYLQRRYRTWYAVLEIPKALRSKLGGARFVRSLKTDSQRIAETRALPLVAEWKRQIEMARTGNEGLEGEVHRFRSIVAELEKHPKSDEVLAFSERAILPAITDSIDEKTPPDVANWAREMSAGFEVALGRRLLLSEHLSAYLATQRHLQQKSQDMKTSDLRRFVRKFKFAEDADRFSLIDWIENELMGQEGLSEATCRRIVSACRGYWEFLERHKSLALPKPFDGVVPARKGSKKAQPNARRPFLPADYKALLEAVPKQDKNLHDIIILGAYTGARIEELCSLKLDAVFDEHFEIKDAKTPAGHRIIPIHSAIADKVNELASTSADGYLLSGLSTNKYGDRSNAIGKRFGRLKTKVGFNKQHVFHSLRKGVATQLEQAGIPENEAARLLGHDITTMTYGLYSGGNLKFERLQEIVECLEW